MKTYRYRVRHLGTLPSILYLGAPFNFRLGPAGSKFLKEAPNERTVILTDAQKRDLEQSEEMRRFQRRRYIAVTLLEDPVPAVVPAVPAAEAAPAAEEEKRYGLYLGFLGAEIPAADDDAVSGAAFAETPAAPDEALDAVEAPQEAEDAPETHEEVEPASAAPEAPEALEEVELASAAPEAPESAAEAPSEAPKPAKKKGGRKPKGAVEPTE